MVDLPKQPFLQATKLPRPRSSYPDKVIEAAAANSGGGGAVYQHSQFLDRANALQVSAGTRTQLPMDGNGPLTNDEFLDTIPRPALPARAMIDNNTFRPIETGDIQLLKLNIEAAISAPILSANDANSGISVEFESIISGPLNVDEDFKRFRPDPAPFRRDMDLISAINAIPILGSALSSELTDATNRHTAAVAAQTNGQAFIVTSLIVATPPVQASGVKVYVNPTVDVDIWNIRWIVARINSPTT